MAACTQSDLNFLARDCLTAWGLPLHDVNLHNRARQVTHILRHHLPGRSGFLLGRGNHDVTPILDADWPTPERCPHWSRMESDVMKYGEDDWTRNVRMRKGEEAGVSCILPVFERVTLRPVGQVRERAAQE